MQLMSTKQKLDAYDHSLFRVTVNKTNVISFNCEIKTNLVFTTIKLRPDFLLLLKNKLDHLSVSQF